MTLSLPIVWSEPFGRNAQLVRMQEGRTIAELVEEGILEHGLSPSFRTYGTVCINGEEVPRDLWYRVRPRVRSQIEVIVTFHLSLQGGSGGGGGGGAKNPLAAVALIAVLVASTLVTGGLGIPLLGGTLIGSLTVGQALGTAILAGGSLAVAALIPPPRITQPTASSAGSTDNEGRPASLSANVLLPGASIPRVIGTRRVYPPAACEPLNELVGNDEFVECVYILSGAHAISEIRAGSVPIDQVADVYYELKSGFPGDIIQTLVDRQGRTSRLNTEAHAHKVTGTDNVTLDTSISISNALPQWEGLVTREAVDEFWIRLAFVEGLSDDLATTDAERVINIPVRIRFRQRGTVTWTNCPEIHFSSKKVGGFQKDIRFQWTTAPSFYNTPPTTAVGTHDTKISVDRAPIYAIKWVPNQTASPAGASAQWDADLSGTGYFSRGATNDLLSFTTFTSNTSNVRNVDLFYDRVVFYLDPATFPKSGVYEVQIMRGTGYRETSFNEVNYNYTPSAASGGSTLVYDFFSYYIRGSGGVSPYIVPVDHTGLHDRMLIVSTASVWNENPLDDPTFAALAVKVHGRSVDQLSMLASGYTYDWDGSGWNTLTTTSNPAPHYYDILTGPLNADPLPVDLVDNADLTAWRQRCIDKSYTCDMIVDGRPAYDVLTAVAASGYARPRQSEKWGVLMDKDRSAETPVQVFNPRNMAAFRFERPFPLLPTGFNVRFDDITNDYIEDEVIVLDPYNPAADESRLEDQRYDTFVRSADAVARATFDLKQATLRFVFFYGTCDAENIVCRRGDLVAVQHDVLLRQAGFSRVTSVISSGGNTTGIVLDGSIPVPVEDAWSDTGLAWSSYASAWALPRTGVAIRLEDDTIMVKEVKAISDPARSLTFISPFPNLSTLDVECLVTSGSLGQTYQRMIVFDIQPKGADFTADLTFVPEAPELWGNPTLIRTLREVGLLDSLVLALDPADGESYSVETTQRWRDTSGQANHFYFGPTGAPGTTNPHFNGTIDSRASNTFMTTDGLDFFQEVNLGTWDQPFHKDGGKFTFILTFYPALVALESIMVANSSGASTVGYQFEMNASRQLALNRSNGSIFNTLTSTALLTLNAWAFVAVSVDENGGAGASHFRIGSTTETFNASFPTASASNSASKTRIYLSPLGGFTPDGTRIGMLACWNRALSVAETANLYQRWKTERMPGLI